MSAQRFFITGTDTGVGKTLTATGLLRAAAAQGLSTLGLKPVSAGCVRHGEEWHNEDALAIQSAATLSLPYVDINPVAVEPPIAPHIALADEQRRVAAAELAQQCTGVLRRYAPDFAVIEGAGGWLVPLNDSESLADFAAVLGAPVILVVGLRLGCLNHALLTAQAIASRGLPLAGWIGSCLTDPPMPRQAENLLTLEQRLPGPCIGVLPYLGSAPDADSAAAHLQLAALPGGRS
jgi:dethiobiotin synthetase